MTGIVMGFGFALVTALVVIIGDFLIKIAADTGQGIGSIYVILGCALYAVSAIFWFYSMRHVTLAQAGVAYSMLTLLALCLIGSIWFDERLLLREYLGILCALSAMVLMVRIA